MASPLESFFIALGFEVDAKELDAAEKKLDSVLDKVAGFGKAVAAAAVAATYSFQHIIGELDELGDFATSINVPVEMLSQLGYAAKLSGSDLEAVKSSLAGLSRITGEAANGVGRGKKAFEDYHLSAKNADGTTKTVIQVFDELADRVKNLDQVKAIALANKMGIDTSLVPLLKSGSASIQELREEAIKMGAVTQEQADQAGAAQDAIDRLTFTFKGFSNALALSVAPAMSEIIDNLRKWIVANRELIQQRIKPTLDVLASIVKYVAVTVATLVDGFYSLIEVIYKNKLALAAFMAAAMVPLANLAGAVALALYNKLGKVLTVIGNLFSVAAIKSALLIGVLALVVLAIEDIYTFFQGGESFTGDFVKWFSENIPEAFESFREGIGAVIDSLGGLWDAVKELGAAVMPILAMIGRGWLLLLPYIVNFVSFAVSAFARFVSFVAYGWANLTAWAAAAVAKIVDIFTWLVTTVQTGWQLLADAAPLIWQALVNAASSVFEAVGSVFDKVRTFITDGFEYIGGIVDRFVDKIAGIKDKVAGFFNGVKEFFGVASPSVAANVSVARQAASVSAPIAQLSGESVVSNNTQSSATVTNNVTVPQINITTPDPQRAGLAVKDQLRELVGTTTRNAQSNLGI